MYIYYKYASDGTIIVLLTRVDYCTYWYKSGAIVKWFVDTLGKILHVKFLVFSHLFVSINISQMNDHSISLYQYRYATYIVAKYMDTSAVNKSKRFYKTTFPSDKIFTKYDVSTSDEQVEKLTRQFNI